MGADVGEALVQAVQAMEDVWHEGPVIDMLAKIPESVRHSLERTAVVIDREFSWTKVWNSASRKSVRVS